MGNDQPEDNYPSDERDSITGGGSDGPQYRVVGEAKVSSKETEREQRDALDEQRERDADWLRENQYWSDKYGDRHLDVRSKHYAKVDAWQRDVAEELSNRCRTENRTEYPWTTDRLRYTWPKGSWKRRKN